ncbi:MAG: hypothetical protein FJY29_03980 [Betaproteobacteria bacterium]|nr:hypothetical protein [Betaproteobacteria bacterium]
MNLLKRISAVRVVALSLLLVVLLVSTFMWPVVRFIYRERTFAEAVRKYSATSGVAMTADDDVRQYLVKLAKHHRLELGEGDVEIDYLNTPEVFGVPSRIGYTLSAKIDFHGVRQVPFVAQRSFELPQRNRPQQESK